MPKPRNQFAIRSLGFGAFTPSPSAPTPRQNKICSLQKSGLAEARQKEKHTSYNTAYAATACYVPPQAFAHICQW